MIKNKEKLIRLYPGVRPDQAEYIKKQAKKKKVGDGEMQRIIIDYYMANNK